MVCSGIVKNYKFSVKSRPPKSAPETHLYTLGLNVSPRSSQIDAWEPPKISKSNRKTHEMSISTYMYVNLYRNIQKQIFREFFSYSQKNTSNMYTWLPG